ncbi:hypothetical protein ACOMHN_052682 [Nucella lapillus]
MRISKTKEVLASNHLSLNRSGLVTIPSITAFSKRSEVSGNATFLAVAVLSAYIDDLVCSYQCCIKSLIRGGTIYENISTIDLDAGAYPGQVNLSASPAQRLDNEKGGQTGVSRRCRGFISAGQ